MARQIPHYPDGRQIAFMNRKSGVMIFRVFRVLVRVSICLEGIVRLVDWVSDEERYV